MKKLMFIILFVLAFAEVKAQDVSCEDLKDFIIKKGSYQSEIPNYIMNSSWLYKVTCYMYEGKYYIIAEIKENQYSFTTKSYVFCGIPFSNWYDFKDGGIYGNSTYGERFHTYIKDYVCKCY